MSDISGITILPRPQYWYRNSLDREWCPWYGQLDRLEKTIKELKQSGTRGDYTIIDHEEYQRRIPKVIGYDVGDAGNHSVL